MREYKLIERDYFYLVPLGESPPGHVIRFADKTKAHEYRLALGLGTHTDPDKTPENYRLMPEKYGQAPIYEVSVERAIPDEERDPGCCQSGCPGCPWTLEQIRLGKL